MPNGRKQQGVAYSIRVPLARDSTAEEPRYFWEKLGRENDPRSCYGPPEGPKGVSAAEMAAQTKANGDEAATHSPSDLGWFRSKVDYGKDWDYKKYNPDFEPYGNYHYGYVGTRQGIPGWFLRAMAGAAQVKKGTSELGFITSAFDDPKDRKQIDRGIHDALKGCY